MRISIIATILVVIISLLLAGCYEESSYSKNYMKKPPNEENNSTEQNSYNSNQGNISKETFTYIVDYYKQPVYMECFPGGAYSTEYYHYILMPKVENLFNENSIEKLPNIISCSEFELQKIFIFWDQSLYPFSYEEYQYGYIYSISFYVDEKGYKLFDKILSKEKSYKEFTLTFDTYSLPDVINGQVIEEPRSLFKKVSESRYIAYRSLEFEVYYQDLIEELDLRLEHNKTVTLTFNFEDNGTIYLQEILENWNRYF